MPKKQLFVKKILKKIFTGLSITTTLEKRFLPKFFGDFDKIF